VDAALRAFGGCCDPRRGRGRRRQDGLADPAALREEGLAVTGAFERAGNEKIGSEASGVEISSGIEPALEKGADVGDDFTTLWRPAPRCRLRGPGSSAGDRHHRIAEEQKGGLRAASRRVPLLLAPT